MAEGTPPARAAELAALRAAAAQAAAEAEAAEAKAAAAQAALEAAEAASEDVPPPAPADARHTDTVPTPDAEPAAPASYADVVREGYTSDAPALPLGALLSGTLGGDPTPDATVQVGFPLATLNRHGLVAGATGTGKTKTLQGMAEGLSAQGVPVFLADIKGDLSGLAVEGPDNPKVAERAASIGQEWAPTSYPVEFYSLGGLGTGVPIRTTVTDFGPLLLSKVLGLNATQASSLELIFHWADTQQLALLDLKDLQATIAYLTSDEGKQALKGIGGISTASAGVILREIVGLQAQGGGVFFGEPAFETADLLRTAPDGRGLISALELPGVQDRPALFSTFLMWLLAELFQELPEVGDPDKPRLVFFFDEAHLLFTGASKDFLQQVVQTVRLIRSKGVGVFFVTQSPKDVPADVLAQLGNRVQHALRAFTPDDAKALRAAARTFPTSPYDLERLLQSLGTGEAVVTLLDEKGAPTPVAWTRVRAPQASMDPAPQQVLDAAVATSPGQARYGGAVDRESAYELLQARAAQDTAAREAAERAAELEKEAEKARRDAGRAPRTSGTPSRRSSRSPVDAILTTVGTTLAREITRTVFGTRRRR
ncbi:helicase HerA-like domain-containing protein [Krasilnikoviella flava]|uniref:Helicase HerA-like C-terminal domain-containing protein n=1 Tax=Krasilnikoviella flava TaxID=526729 RepID=A0A1T5KW86_9MICO|nr:helicase HerA-like domain-containing protein [Krasilnikoviella flava]SKC68054.1 hypothetical protein SAMN04324258_2528 [Krasilnikoviella flava]